MIVTVTPNPSIDRTIELPALRRGAVLRADAARLDPGGKGVNVARAVAGNGGKAVAVLPCGGVEGRQLAALLAAEGIEVVTVPIGGTVRSNVTLVESDGTTTKINEPGPVLTPAELEQLLAAAVAACGSADWVVGSGSLPPGTPAGFYAELVRRARAAGALVAVDTAGAALRATLAARPDLVKPNREELADVAGVPIVTLGAALHAAAGLCEAGAGAVLATLGADGALLVDATGAVHGEAPVPAPRSTVGAGDATLAGFLAGGGAGDSALVEALAWGAAATGLPGSRMPEPADLARDAVRLHPRVDLNRLLGGQH